MKKELSLLLTIGLLSTGCQTTKLENKVNDLERTEKNILYWPDALATGWIPGYGIIKDYIQYKKEKREYNKTHKSEE